MKPRARNGATGNDAQIVGPPCAYHFGLTNAKQLLAELGAADPDLPPFDESKFEPMPDVDINPKDEFWVDPATLDSEL